MQTLVCLKLSQRLLTLPLCFLDSFFLIAILIGCFLLPYILNCWFNSQLHPLYCGFPVNCSLFQLVHPMFLTGSFYAFEILTRLHQHPYNQGFEFCIWLLFSILFSSFSGALFCFHLDHISCLFILAVSCVCFYVSGRATTSPRIGRVV